MPSAHYNGATLWFPNAPNATPEILAWKGSHLAVTFSPDGRFLVTAMQEPTLHGWRVVDGRHMRMAGYAAKVRAIAWSTGGKWLASSGSDQLVLWPFAGKDGPMGKEPRLLAPTDKRVVAVACHPTQDVVAVGYENGLVLLVRIDDGAEIVASKPGGAAVVGARLERGRRELGVRLRRRTGRRSKALAPYPLVGAGNRRLRQARCCRGKDHARHDQVLRGTDRLIQHKLVELRDHPDRNPVALGHRLGRISDPGADVHAAVPDLDARTLRNPVFDRHARLARR